MTQVSYQHKNLVAGRWRKFSFFKQMADIGSEVSRALNWRGKNHNFSQAATDRALELLDLTIADDKNRKYGKELWRIREAVVDFFYFDNQFKSSELSWRRYFDAFAYAANLSG
ncbi:MAG: hypothetical protein HYT63_02365 [Candidatus Yanofskybacteria bacterium]|nr:hypothetical protein [Candidatus Yanofskybacteria bacterium]